MEKKLKVILPSHNLITKLQVTFLLLKMRETKSIYNNINHKNDFKIYVFYNFKLICKIKLFIS